jgi:hypothetical protein
MGIFEKRVLAVCLCGAAGFLVCNSLPDALGSDDGSSTYQDAELLLVFGCLLLAAAERLWFGNWKS